MKPGDEAHEIQIACSRAFGIIPDREMQRFHVARKEHPRKQFRQKDEECETARGQKE